MGERSERIEEEVWVREARVSAWKGGIWEAIWRMISFGICIMAVVTDCC